MKHTEEQINNLENKITKLQNQLNDYENKFSNLIETLEKHQHNGFDGSSRFQGDIIIPNTSAFESGSAQFGGTNIGTTQIGAIIVGSDRLVADGSDNTQFIISHNSGGSFIFANKNPLFTSNDGSISSGGTTLTQSTYKWITNSLAGSLVNVYTNSTTWQTFTIASNTANELTISGGTWAGTVSNASWEIYQTVYLGAANYPFRRAYVGETTSGGVRFGGGNTNGGQNGLLYMDSSGDLYWRNLAGSPTKLN